jgi:hypothetical protein
MAPSPRQPVHGSRNGCKANEIEFDRERHVTELEGTSRKNGRNRSVCVWVVGSVYKVLVLGHPNLWLLEVGIANQNRT